MAGLFFKALEQETNVLSSVTGAARVSIGGHMERIYFNGTHTEAFFGIPGRR